jgi:DNA adenine methylase
MGRSIVTASLLGEFYEQVSTARSFLRWVGGKQTFVARFGHVLPPVAGRYFEPFLGSGAVFFYLQRRHGRPLEAVLGDVNLPLVRTYMGVREDPAAVAEEIAVLATRFAQAEDRAAFYYQIRDQYNASLPNPSPALFVFLNRTCWNGLYRINQRGQFNVPFGRPKVDVVFPSGAEFERAAAALVRAKLKAAGWETSISKAGRGDFLFLDPPYYSDIVRGDAVKYQRWRFGLREHEKLASRLRALADRGADFVLTNSAEQVMHDLYASKGLSAIVVEMPRSVSGKISERNPARELIVTPPRSAELWLEVARGRMLDLDAESVTNGEEVPSLSAPNDGEG